MKNINPQNIKVGDCFVWAFIDFEGSHVYTCQCISKNDNELVADVAELGAVVNLDNTSFCDLYGF